MAEEKQPEQKIDTGLGMDDMSVLRTLLHNIKGLSPVSSAVTYTEIDDEDAA